MKEWQKKFIDNISNKIKPEHLTTNVNRTGLLNTIEKSNDSLLELLYLKSTRDTEKILLNYTKLKKQNELKQKRANIAKQLKQNYADRKATIVKQEPTIKFSPMQVSNFQCSMDLKQTIDLVKLFEMFVKIKPIVEYAPQKINIKLKKITLQKARFKPIAEFTTNYGMKRNINAPPQSIAISVDVNGYGANISIWKSGKISMMGSVISKNVTINTQKETINDEIKKVPKILQNYITQAMTDSLKKKVKETRFIFNNLAGMFTFNKNPVFIEKKIPTDNTFFKHARTKYTIDLRWMRFKQPKQRKIRSNKKQDNFVDYEAMGVNLPQYQNKVNQMMNQNNWKHEFKAELKKMPMLPLEMRNKKNIVHKFKGISYIPVFNRERNEQMFTILIATEKNSNGAVIKIQGMKGSQSNIGQRMIDAYRVTLSFLTWTYNIEYSKGNKRNTIDLAPKKISNKTSKMTTSCPTNKRPDPYTFEGKCPNGYHVRPNKQGRPCCYKDPKSVTYMQSQILKAYKQAGIKIPESIKKMYLLKNNVNTKLTNKVKMAMINMPTRIEGGKLILGSRQCERYTKPELRDIAKRMGVLGSDRMKKDALCEAIKSKTKNKNITKRMGKTNLTVTVGGKERTLIVIDNTLKFIKTKGGWGQGMSCISFTQKQLVNVASQLNIATSSDPSKVLLCREITKHVLKIQKEANNKIKKLVKKNLNFSNLKNTRFLRYEELFDVELKKLSKGKIKSSPDFLKKTFNAFFTNLPTSEVRRGSKGQGSIYVMTTYKVNNKPNLVVPRIMPYGKWMEVKPYVFNKKNFSAAAVGVYRYSLDDFAKKAASHFKSFYN